MTLNDTIRSKVESSFAAQAMMRTFGASIDTLEAGTVTLSAPILPACTQQHGFGHAALTFGLGDSAAGYAALSVMPEQAEVLTTEMKINLMSPAAGDRLLAIGRVIKPGRKLVIVQADVWAVTGETRKHVALLTGTMIPVMP